MRKIAAAEVSWLTLSSRLRCCSICRITRLALFRPWDLHSRVSCKSEVQLPRMQVRNLRTWYWETRTALTLRHESSRSFRLRWKRRQQQVWGKKVPGTYCSRKFRWKSGFIFLHGSLQYNSDSSIAPSSGLLLIQPQLLQLITECSSGYCESCWGH